MSDEQRKTVLRGKWPFIVAISLLIAGYVLMRYTLERDPSSLAQHVVMCTTDYKHASTASDTAKIDALIPPWDGYMRRSEARNCGYYREAGSTK